MSANAPVLAASGKFVNNSGASAVTATGGSRWLIYSNAPGTDTFGNLNSNNTAIWGATYASLPPASVAETGNRYIFAQSPTLTVTTTNDTKVYGVDATAAVARDYTVTGYAAATTGAYLSDTAATAYSGTPSVTSAGTSKTATVGGQPYQITATAGSMAGQDGYGVVFANTGELTVTPATLTPGLTGTVSKVYDSTTAATLAAGNYTLSGTVNGDSVSLNNPAAGTYAAAKAGSGISVSVSGLALTGSAAGNYVLASTSASANIGTITPAPLTAAADNQSRSVGQPNPPLTYAITSGRLFGSDTFTGALATPATQASPSGSYPITVGTLTAGANYALTFVDGSFVITTPPNIGASPLMYATPYLSKVSASGAGGAQPGLTTCSAVDIASLLNSSGMAVLYGAGACGGL